MALEAVIDKNTQDGYGFELKEVGGEPVRLGLQRMIFELIEDLRNKVEAGVIAARFHNGLSGGLLAMALRAREQTSLNQAALSGVVFCNRYLAEQLIKLLKEHDFEVSFNKNVPSNDGGISVGQAAIGIKHVLSKKRSR